MKGKYPVLIVFVLLLGSTMASAGAWKFDASKVHFYQYGISTCPHCQRMKKLIPETYGPDKFTYYELNGNQHNDKIFDNISRLTGITGVPAIGITYNGTLVAVIEGEFNVSATPKIVKLAFDHNGTLLFVGGKTYILPHNNTESLNVVKKLYYLFVEAGEPAQITMSSPKTTTPTPVKTTTTSGGVLSTRTTTSKKGEICGPATIIGLAIIPLLLRRRR